MLSRLLVVLYFVLGVPFTSSSFSAVARFSTPQARSSNSQVTVCVAGQCLQGFSNISLGETISAQGGASAQLLPGQYTSTTDPQLLNIMLTSSSATLSLSPGFNSSSVNPLPLNIALQPGIAIYSNAFFAGQAAFSKLPSSPINNSIPLPASSLALSDNVWAALTSGSSRFVFWNSVPNVSQLPQAISLPLALVDIQSSSCNPPCSSSTVCSASATCDCPPGFTGSSCESCADGFFGPTCQPCPSNSTCQSCDQGTAGSGRCLVPIISNAPATCNCLNGLCGANGTCTCNPGWTHASNGTACAQCAPGFFLTTTGDCLICHIGCTQCADGTGDCIACKSGVFTQDENDKTLCDPLPAVTSGGTQCPDGSYNAGGQCAPCSPSCATCNGPTSKNCIVCATGLSLFQGNCVAVGSNGVCAGTGGMIADNIKQECDACGAKCTSCEIPNFSVASLVSQRLCTDCLPGFFLSQGQCNTTCPSGNFISPKDNMTCTACSSSCVTCLGSADFCLSCPNQKVASSGQCVSACPTGTFSSSGTCLKCHPDCQSCTGQSFTQCSACPPMRPVLSSGRCLPTCDQSQFFDLTSSSCQDCDSSCASCSGSGSTNCLACSGANQVLRAGTCVSANCAGSTSVIPDLGVCLSELVQVSSGTNPTNSINSNTATASTISSAISSSSFSSSSVPIPSSGATGPTVSINGDQFLWWQILLIALSGVFFLILILVLWRRYARRLRAEETFLFGSARQIDGTNGWRWRLRHLKKSLFGDKVDGYNVDIPHMASRGNGISHPRRNPDIELRPSELPSHPIPIPKSRHRPTPERGHRSDNHRPKRGYRSENRSPKKGYFSDDRSPTRVRRSDNHPKRRNRSEGRSPTRGYHRSPTRGDRSDDRYPVRKRRRSDDRYPTRGHHSDDRYPTRGHHSDDRYPTRRRRSVDRSPPRGHHSDDRRGHHSDDRYPTRGHHSDDRYPTRGHHSDDRYPTRGHRSNDRSPPRVYHSDVRSAPRVYPDVRSPTRVYQSDVRSAPRVYPDVRSPTRVYHPDILSPTTQDRSRPIDRWDDRLDNSLSRYPRPDGKLGAPLIFSPPPSYPSQKEHRRASLALLR